MDRHRKGCESPNSFPRAQEDLRFAYAYLGHHREGEIPAGRWTGGPSLDGQGRFEPMVPQPLGGKPSLAPPRPDSGAQTEQMG